MKPLNSWDKILSQKFKIKDAADSRQKILDSRNETVETKQQTVDSRHRRADNRQ
jgi:hypothetical protein